MSGFSSHACPSRRGLLIAGAAALLAGCASTAIPPGPTVTAPAMTGDAFVMRDGARLPFRTWRPSSPPRAVVLALHGFNDSRDGWEMPAPDFAAAGIAVYAPDQRGFGEAPGRGAWPGSAALVNDAADMTQALRARHPGTKLILMGESMGGSVLMLLATGPQRPDVDGYVLLAPAVWDRGRMNPFMRALLWLAGTMAPGLQLSGPPPSVRIYATDNDDALRRLSRNPLTILSTRVDAVRGLADLMDEAQAAAASFTAPALFLYGARDEIVPAEATKATWSALPSGRVGLYPNGWHMLLRDLGRASPIGDTIAWIDNRTAPLPSGAEANARTWLTAG